jgi:hypothetical protein
LVTPFGSIARLSEEYVGNERASLGFVFTCLDG